MEDEIDSTWVDLAYYTILRRYQQENLKSYDEDEWPRKIELINYRSKIEPEVNYYFPEDQFIELGEWLRDRNIRRRREVTAKKKDTMTPPTSVV